MEETLGQLKHLYTLVIQAVLLRRVQFLNQNTGYISGDEGEILKTTDSGQHWFSQNFDQLLGVNLLKIFFINETYGWGVGTYEVLHTSNGGGIAQLMINYPNGGEVLPAGQPAQISWISNGINNVNLKYTTNGGATWVTIANNVNASSGFYNWNDVPNSEISSVKILIQNSVNSNIFDYGDSYFSISQVSNSLEGYVTDATTGLAI